MTIAVIVPNLPPTACGVYDYTRKLHEHWQPGEKWTLLCSHAGQPWPGASAIKIERSAESLARALRELAPERVALQYTCYGYATDGVPAWLAEGLETFKKNSRARVAVMFHELWYDGPAWRRAHWRKPRQQALAARLCGMADAALSGVPEWNQQLQSADKRVLLAPIPSNIEPLAIDAQRSMNGPLELAVFGLPESRAKALAVHKRVLKALGKDCVLHEIGSGTPSTTEQSISRQLASCHALLSPADASLIWKSGAAMAATAHGCAVIVAGTPKLGGPPVVGYGRGKRSLAAILEHRILSEAGKASRKWYEANSGWPRAVASWQAALE